MNKNPNAIRVLAGDGLSAFGAWIDFLAILTLAAWQFQVSPLQMAAVSAAGLLPGILAGPALGRWCDRGDVSQTRQIPQALFAYAAPPAVLPLGWLAVLRRASWARLKLV